jgi:hypothetical protein
MSADPLPIEIHGGRLAFSGERGLRTLTDVSGQMTYSAVANRLEYRLAGDAGRAGRVQVKGQVTSAGGGPLQLSAHVEAFGAQTSGQATLALQVQGPLRAPTVAGQIEGAGEITLLPGVRATVGGSLAGTVSAEGSSGEWRPKGTVTLEKGRFAFPGQPPVTDLRGRISWTHRGAETAALTGRWGAAEVSARLQAGWGGSPPTLRGDLSASTLDLTPILHWVAGGLAELPASAGASAAPPGARLLPQAQAAPAAPAWPPWTRALGVDLRLRAASVRLNGEPLGPLQAQLWAAGGLWHLQGIRLTLPEGEPHGYVRLDLRTVRPRGTLFVKGPGLALFTGGLPEPYRPVSGELTVETLLQWEGLSWREFKQSARGRGEVRIRDGRLATARLIRHVEIQGIPRSTWEGRSLLAFEDLTARYRIAGARVVTQALTLSGPAWEVRGEGVVHLSGRLDFRLTGRASEVPRLTGFLRGDLARPRLVLARGG